MMTLVTAMMLTAMAVSKLLERTASKLTVIRMMKKLTLIKLMTLIKAYKHADATAITLAIFLTLKANRKDR